MAMSAECLDLVISSIYTVATCIGVAIAWRALTEWKRIRHSELAEQIIDHVEILVGIIHSASFLSRAEGEEFFNNLGSVQRNATVVVDRLRNREDDLRRTFGLASKAERHLDGDGEAISKDMVMLRRYAQNVYNAAWVLAEGLNSSDREELIRTVWSEQGADALGVEVDCLAKSIEMRLKRWL